VQGRREILAGHEFLLKEADAHWRFEVHAVAAGGVDLIAGGTITGVFPTGAQRVELHAGAELTAVQENGDLRLLDVAPEAVPTGTMVFSETCWERVH
jgi:hypothetical protein